MRLSQRGQEIASGGEMDLVGWFVIISIAISTIMSVSNYMMVRKSIEVKKK